MLVASLNSNRCWKYLQAKYWVKCQLLSIFLIFFCQHSFSKVYFISKEGNDLHTHAQAQNPLTPWRTLNKLNESFSSLMAGDSVLFRKGDLFEGSITVSKSGAIFAPIFFGAYGEGNSPEINGFSEITKWQFIKPGIYAAKLEDKPGSLSINGVLQALGRFPNVGYMTYESATSNSIRDEQLSDAINWTGAEVVIRKNRWTLDRSQIVGQNNKSIQYAAGNKAAALKGYGYFIQNHIKTLDKQGEWYFDEAGKNLYVYFGSTDPSKTEVRASTVNTLVDIQKFSHIIFDGLVFRGSAGVAIDIIQGRNITIQNCRIDQSGSIGVLASYSPFLTIENCIINNSLSGGINLDQGCVNAVIVGNEIINTGMLAGMGLSGSGTYEAITSFGDMTNIERNRIDSVGYNGIYFGGNSSQAKNNYITRFCMTKDDGAGIYIGDWSKTSHKKIIDNIILDGIGNGLGTNYPKSLQAEGIYIDDNSESVLVSGNTVSKCANNGIKIHNAKKVDIVNNTIFNNGIQLRLEQDNYLATSSLIRENNITNNVFFSTNHDQSNVKVSSHDDDIFDFGRIDSNFYNRFENKDLPIQASYTSQGKLINQSYTMSSWKKAHGKDYSSQEVSSDAVFFDYNPNVESKKVMLSNVYIDVNNIQFKGEITIRPFSSLLLIPDTRKLAQLPPKQPVLVAKLLLP